MLMPAAASRTSVDASDSSQGNKGSRMGHGNKQELPADSALAAHHLHMVHIGTMDESDSIVPTSASESTGKFA